MYLSGTPNLKRNLDIRQKAGNILLTIFIVIKRNVSFKSEHNDLCLSQSWKIIAFTFKGHNVMSFDKLQTIQNLLNIIHVVK